MFALIPRFTFRVLSSALCLSLWFGFAIAADAPIPTCAHSIERPIAFRSAKSDDRIRVSIGGGPCPRAWLNITISSAAGEVLYRYRARFGEHVMVMVDDPDYRKRVREFVNDTATRGIVARADLPDAAKMSSPDNDTPYSLVAPRVDYERLVRSGQPVFHHATNYEAGRYVAYDPKTKKARVMAEWGV